MAGKAEQRRTAQIPFGHAHSFCRMGLGKGWAQQFHLGALRNNNSRMMQTLGPDTGWDSIGDFRRPQPGPLLDKLDANNKLAKRFLQPQPGRQ